MAAYRMCPVCGTPALTLMGERTTPCGACIGAIERLAESLSRKAQEIRLRRIGEEVPATSVPFSGLPPEDRENWRTLAQAVMELGQDSLWELLDDALNRTRGATT